MKKLAFLLFAFLFVGSLSAQDHEKAAKKARRLLAAYNMDSSTTAKLAEARESIDHAMTGDLSGLKTPYEPYLVMGEIYNTIASNEVVAVQIAKEGGPLAAKANVDVIKVDKAAIIAYEALAKAIELTTKGSQKKKVLEALKIAQQNIANFGIMAYETASFDKAFTNFETVVKAHELIKANDGESTLDVEGGFDNQLYLIGLAGLNAKKYEESKPYLVQLYDNNFDEPLIYSSLYSIDAENDREAAYKYLEAGRKKYPKDNNLLFEEINHFLKLGKLDELLGRLNTAIEMEPNNVSLYTTLGNVYDQLYQAEEKVEGGGDEEKKTTYFAAALKNYNIAVEKDPKNVDATYSIGALYFNKAALVTQEMIKLNDDLSKEGMKKFNALKAQSNELFNQALPSFKKAENLNPDDLNTLIALKEIYARIDELEKSNAFKVRMENVQNGGTNDKSYFNE
ncbi:MAG: tetratricopeptide (TPR) repeat protein [Saprospiraceae bacterium]|jgi:tetratricopeptide (TPR) repeat protein